MKPNKRGVGTCRNLLPFIFSVFSASSQWEKQIWEECVLVSKFHALMWTATHFFPGASTQPFCSFSSVQLSCSVVSDSLWPHGLQHVEPPGPSPIPRVYSNSMSIESWCHPTISSSIIPFSSHLQSFPASGSFQMGQFFCIRWPKYWCFNFSFSTSNEYSGLIFFRMDWLDLLVVQGILNNLLQHHKKYQLFGA